MQRKIIRKYTKLWKIPLRSINYTNMLITKQCKIHFIRKPHINASVYFFVLFSQNLSYPHYIISYEPCNQERKPENRLNSIKPLHLKKAHSNLQVRLFKNLGRLEVRNKFHFIARETK